MVRRDDTSGRVLTENMRWSPCGHAVALTGLQLATLLSAVPAASLRSKVICYLAPIEPWRAQGVMVSLTAPRAKRGVSVLSRQR